MFYWVWSVFNSKIAVKLKHYYRPLMRKDQTAKDQIFKLHWDSQWQGNEWNDSCSQQIEMAENARTTQQSALAKGRPVEFASLLSLKSAHGDGNEGQESSRNTRLINYCFSPTYFFNSSLIDRKWSRSFEKKKCFLFDGGISRSLWSSKSPCDAKTRRQFKSVWSMKRQRSTQTKRSPPSSVIGW